MPTLSHPRRGTRARSLLYIQIMPMLRGITKTATHFYVLDFANSNVYAYNASTKVRDTSKEFTVGSGYSWYSLPMVPTSMLEFPPLAKAYQLSDGARVPARDVYLGQPGLFYDLCWIVPCTQRYLWYRC